MVWFAIYLFTGFIGTNQLTCISVHSHSAICMDKVRFGKKKILKQMRVYHVSLWYIISNFSGSYVITNLMQVGNLELPFIGDISSTHIIILDER